MRRLPFSWPGEVMRPENTRLVPARHSRESSAGSGSRSGVHGSLLQRLHAPHLVLMRGRSIPRANWGTHPSIPGDGCAPLHRRGAAEAGGPARVPRSLPRSSLARTGQRSHRSLVGPSERAGGGTSHIRPALPGAGPVDGGRGWPPATPGTCLKRDLAQFPLFRFRGAPAPFSGLFRRGTHSPRPSLPVSVV